MMQARKRASLVFLPWNGTVNALTETQDNTSLNVHLTKNYLDNLEKPDTMVQRSILTEYGNPSKVFMCLELGVIPVRFVVIEKRLKFLKYILDETSIP